MRKVQTVNVSEIVIERFDHFPQLSKSGFGVFSLDHLDSPSGGTNDGHHAIEQAHLHGKGCKVLGGNRAKQVIKADQICK